MDTEEKQNLLVLIVPPPATPGAPSKEYAILLQPYLPQNTTAVYFSTDTDRHIVCDSCSAGWCKGYACTDSDGFGGLTPHLSSVDVVFLYVPEIWAGLWEVLNMLRNNIRANFSPLNNNTVTVHASRLLFPSNTASAEEQFRLNQFHASLCTETGWEELIGNMDRP